MNLEKTLSSVAILTALSLSSPASAQQGRNDHQRGGGRATASQPAQRNDGGRQAVERQAPRQAAPQQARQAAPPANYRQYAPAQAVPRSPGGHQSSAPLPQAPRATQNFAVPRQYTQPSSPSRSYGPSGQAYRNDDRHGYAAPRSYYPAYSHGYGYAAHPYYGHAYVRPYGWRAYRPYYFTRPYYSFNPWFSIGFGVWLGYPVPYPWAYLGSYRPQVYGDTGAYGATASVSVYGGMSFDIQPPDADLFVDGQYVGTVGTFTPYGEPLTLTPGQHRIAVQRDGFRAMEWDVTIEPGQVIPYRGAMQRQ